MKTELSKSDLKLMLDIIHDSISCTAQTNFKDLLNRMKALVPFSFARCGFGDSREFGLKKMDAFKMITRFPEEWETRYAQKDYFASDNMALAAVKKNEPVLWSDYAWINGLSDNRNETSQKILAEAASFGLSNGWLHSLMGRRSTEFAFISLGGDEIKKSEQSRKILNYLLPHLGQSIKKIIFGQNEEEIGLTNREHEILSWTAAGKSAWEISVILNISRRTVEFHIANILKKLDTVKASQAVAKAFSMGLIEY
jgi:DNA-binding CsgD family transcriptional regulator